MPCFSVERTSAYHSPCDVRAKLTWLVIGPVSIALSVAKGGLASIATVLPTSFSLYQTCLPSGDAAMLGAEGTGLRDAADDRLAREVEHAR